MAIEVPVLPAQISNDGREIWDWAEKLSAYTHRLDAIRKVRAQLAATGSRCGDCALWMRGCPKDHNVNGYKRGPSCQDIPCHKFTETASSIRRREELSIKLKELESQP